MKPDTDSPIQQLAEFAAHHAWLVFGASAVLTLLIAILAQYLMRRLRASISAEKSLLLHAIAGFAVVFPALALFFELTDALSLDHELGQFDHTLAHTLSQTVSATTYQFFAAATRLGDVEVLTMVTIAVALFLAWHRQWLYLTGWLIAVIGNGVLTRALKALFQRVRPLHDHGYAMAEGWSFPSGHSSSSLAVYGMLAYLLIKGTRREWHAPIALLAIMVILCVGASRVFLQVHFFSDVIAGFCVGAAWLAVCLAGTNMRRNLHKNVRSTPGHSPIERGFD